MTKIPRKSILELNTPVELAIHNAIIEVIELDDDKKLADALLLLEEAKELVSDYIDDQLKDE